ncbi:MAG: hypothetical protein ACI35S_02320 [Anaeroplasma sp.]
MWFINYNDYYLLYLISEGSEIAYIYLFKKYDSLIHKLIIDYYPFGDKRDDLLQEGRLVIFNSLKCFNEYHNISFYSYVLISLKRRFRRLLDNDYYHMPVFSEYQISSYEHHSIYRGSLFFQDELSIKIYDECILGNLKLKNFAKKYNIPYSKLYYKYSNMKKHLKEELLK